MKIESIELLNFEKFYKLMSSNKLTDLQKNRFIRAHRTEIKKVMANGISEVEFKGLMNMRALQKFRPLKNSFTKRGDKILLAKVLKMPPAEVPQYIKQVTKTLSEVNQLDFLPNDKMEALKTYVYRHGSKDELVAFLDYELTKTKDLTKTLYKTLMYHNCGVADYFIRPIHRMDNKTLVKIYSLINKHIKLSVKNGTLADVQAEKTAKWALIQIYRIQNNSKLLNAIKTYKTLS